MNKKPIEIILDSVDFKPLPPMESNGELYATHEGILAIGGLNVKVYQLNNGQRVIAEDDIRKFFV